MKNKRKLLALMCVILLLLTSACTAMTGTKATDEKVWSDLQRIYRSASLVVTGKCVRSYLNENDATCYDLRVSSVIAGTAVPGGLIHCTNGTMKEGETYLLYLIKNDSAVYYSEDTSDYQLVTDNPFPVTGGNEVDFDGTKLSLFEIIANISAQSSVVSAPSAAYYYKDLASLTNASDQIFIGRITDIPALTDTRFRSDAQGSTVENTLPASIMDVEVYGFIKGTLRYGQNIQVVYSPALNEELTDAATLKSFTYNTSNVVLPEKDGIYLFFLVNTPDAKQGYYFCVNPIQGFAALTEEDRIHVTYLNGALSSYYSLDALVRDIRSIVES